MAKSLRSPKTLWPPRVPQAQSDCCCLGFALAWCPAPRLRACSASTLSSCSHEEEAQGTELLLPKQLAKCLSSSTLTSSEGPT